MASIFETIGCIFAILHYQANIDGDDVQFLLGAALNGHDSLSGHQMDMNMVGGKKTEDNGGCSLWMVDFDWAKMTPLSPDAEKRFDFVLDRSDTTVPKARREDAYA
jgi:hypothetical protein